MIKKEYIRFLQTLNTDDTPDNVRKMANLVFQYFETLFPLSTAQGQRIKKLASIAQENWSSTSSDIYSPEEQEPEQTIPFTQLKSLSVGPFRGFAKQEDFDLASTLVLIYGPNGTGKTSFCEALEFGLLGNVAEAENRRFRNQKEYFLNAYTNNFNVPGIVGVDKQGNDISITANEDLYRFFFVEKNRIDNFSHIAAQTPGRQTELISTLFGLDAFDDFVHNFTDNMDQRYIDLEGDKAKILKEKREKLRVFEHQINITIPEGLHKLDEEEKNLAEQYRNDCSFPEMVAELNGSDDEFGKIKLLENELQNQFPVKCNLTTDELHTLKGTIDVSIEEFNTKQKELQNDSQQVSFKKLYEAVSTLKESSPEKCPACETPLSDVVVNPFENADKELVKLQHLGLKQEAVKKLKFKIDTSLSKLSNIINTCVSHLSEDNPLSEIQIAEEETATIEWWKSLHKTEEDELSYWQNTESQVEKLEEADKEIENLIKERSKNKAKLSQLQELSKNVVTLQTLRDKINKERKTAEEEIEKFDSENAKLIADVETEIADVTQNKAIAGAYSLFVQKLYAYKNNLPAQLVADLGDIVVKLYNAFNRQDAEVEKLSVVKLPLQNSQRLEIAFNNNPNIFYDALHILSEGHIRCLGLAILTAKNIQENCPLLIFDDPVNAIDDDHRESIRRTLFEDEFFIDKQIILTCHGEEFFKDIQNLLSEEKAKHSKKVSFLPKEGDIDLRVDHHCTSRNYLINARSHYNRSEIRDSLGKARQALESLTKGKVWSYVRKHGDGSLSIKMSTPNSSIELRNLTEQLKKKIADAHFLDINKSDVLNPIVALLGINGDSREWRYLNKGIHEESNRAEFDRHTVDTIITALEQLDTAIKQ